WSCGFFDFEEDSSLWIEALADVILLSPLLPVSLQQRVERARTTVLAGVEPDDQESSWIPEALGQAEQDRPMIAGVDLQAYQSDPAIIWLGPSTDRSRFPIEDLPASVCVIEGYGYRAWQLINLMPTLLQTD